MYLRNSLFFYLFMNSHINIVQVRRKRTDEQEVAGLYLLTSIMKINPLFGCLNENFLKLFLCWADLSFACLRIKADLTCHWKTFLNNPIIKHSSIQILLQYLYFLTSITDLLLTKGDLSVFRLHCSFHLWGHMSFHPTINY